VLLQASTEAMKDRTCELWNWSIGHWKTVEEKQEKSSYPASGTVPVMLVLVRRSGFVLI